MAHKINPYGNLLGLQQSWWTVAHYPEKENHYYIDNTIRRLIEGFFKQYRIYTSEIIIIRLPQKTIIRLSIFKRKPRSIARSKLVKGSSEFIKLPLVATHPSMIYLLNYLKILLAKRFKGRFILQIKQNKHFYFNVKLLSDLLGERLFKDPFRAYRFIRFALRNYRRKYVGKFRFKRRAFKASHTLEGGKELVKFYVPKPRKPWISKPRKYQNSPKHQNSPKSQKTLKSRKGSKPRISENKEVLFINSINNSKKKSRPKNPS